MHLTLQVLLNLFPFRSSKKIPWSVVEVKIALDKDSNGKISFEEFETLVKALSTVAKMSFDMSKV